MQVQRDSTDTSSRNLPRSLISTTKQPNPRDSSGGGGSFYFPLKIEADPASIATLSNSVADCTMYTILVSIFGAGQVGTSLSPIISNSIFIGFLIITTVGMFCCCLSE